MTGMTVTDAAAAMSPPIPRRELARRLKDVATVGSQYGRRGRRAALYPIDAIMKAHAAWVRDVGGRSSRVPEFRPEGVCPDGQTDSLQQDRPAR